MAEGSGSSSFHGMSLARLTRPMMKTQDSLKKIRMKIVNNRSNDADANQEPTLRSWVTTPALKKFTTKQMTHRVFRKK
jgi:hypothetical protein